MVSKSARPVSRLVLELLRRSLLRIRGRRKGPGLWGFLPRRGALFPVLYRRRGLPDWKDK